jgi:hypothetical protein
VPIVYQPKISTFLCACFRDNMRSNLSDAPFSIGLKCF